MVAGQAVLVVGAGSIGRATARLLRAAGLRVRGVGRTARSADPDFGEIVPSDRLVEYAGWADHVVVVAPLTERTRGLIDELVLRAMRPTAHLVNLGRGPIVDEAALLTALREGRIAAATLDVFETEPLPPDHPLWTAPGVVVSPHLAGDNATCRDELAAQFVDNAERWLDGAPLQNLVDKRLGSCVGGCAEVTELELLRRDELVAGYRSGRISPVEATRAALDAIAAYDPGCTRSCWSTRTARWPAGSEARSGGGAPARRSARSTACRPHQGRPADRGLADVARHAADRRGRPVADDAPAVARLRESGSVFLGKTATPEFAWKGVTDSRRHGPTGNPWDPALTAAVQRGSGHRGRAGDGRLVGRHGRGRLGADPGRVHRDRGAETDVRPGPDPPAEPVRHPVARRADDPHRA